MNPARAVLVSMTFHAILAVACLAQEPYAVLDRASYRGLFLVDPTGAITSITPAVPWQHAHSMARVGNGDFIVTVNVSDAHGSADGIYMVRPDGEVTAVAVGKPFDSPRGVAIDTAGNYVVLNYIYDEGRGQILRVSPVGSVEVLFEDRPLRQPIGIAIDAHGHYIITDRATAGRVWGFWTDLPENGAIYRFDPITRQMTTVRSSIDENENAKFDDLMGHLTGVAIDAEGNYIVLEAPPHLDDNGNWRIPIGDTYLLRIRPDGELLQTIHIPTLDDCYSIGLGIAIDSQGDYIIADAAGITSENGRLLRSSPGGQVSTIVLTPRLGIPGAVVVLPAPPPPTSPQIFGMCLVPGSAPPRIRFSWRAELGQSYRLQRTTTLGGEAWHDLTFQIQGSGADIEYSEQCTDSEQAYYRIQVIDSIIP
jgi:hypothetical protein